MLVQSRILREFDTSATCAVDKIEVVSSIPSFSAEIGTDTHSNVLFHAPMITYYLFKTADTYYRWSSCASYVKGVSVPLLSISSMDDPVCTAEAIPWDECR